MTLFSQQCCPMILLISYIVLGICNAFSTPSSISISIGTSTTLTYLPCIGSQLRNRDPVNQHCVLTKRTTCKMATIEEQPINSKIDKGTSCYEMIPNETSNVLYQRRKGIFFPWRKRVEYSPTSKISFEYNYNQLVVSSSPSVSTREKISKLIVLVHPIGVGIGRWYYDRLLKEIQNMMSDVEASIKNDENMIFLVPDLLGCGSASNPKWYENVKGNSTSCTLNQIPLLQTQNWSNQILDLMAKQESMIDGPIEWYIVSNGGCIPIALDIAYRQLLLHAKENSNNDNPTDTLMGRVTNLILSSPPQINSLIKESDDVLIQKSYKTLTGIAGKVFWWYALRNNGAFIQKFSEKNLASNPDNLGREWRPKCVETANVNQGRSRYSTFAFLAGSLNGGNLEILNALKADSQLKIDVITGGDKRRNKAKSWFWSRSNSSRVGDDGIQLHQENNDTSSTTTLYQYLKDNEFSVNEVLVGGRRCPAHEDAKGFAQALLKILQKDC